MKYENMLKWLYNRFGIRIKYDLKRINHLLDLLNHPENNFRTIHVAGSKGKGSVSAFLASIFKEAKYKTGLYTSPHLNRYTERFQINGKEINKTEIASIFSKIIKIIDDENWVKYGGIPTFFEITTSMAFQYFYDNNIDIAVIEVGLGGRLDATNVIKPMASIITNIGLEHTELLGNTLAKIAREKAGIIKNNIPVFTGELEEEPLTVIKEIALENNSELFCLNKDIFIKNIKINKTGTGFDLKNKYAYIKNIHIPLIGDFQAINSSLAITSIQYLTEKGIISVPNEVILNGIKKTQWPGRFEIVRKNPMIIVDGAHTLESSLVIKNNIINLFSGKKFTIIFGVMKDKRVDDIIKTLSSISDVFIITRPDTIRAMPPNTIKNIAVKYIDKIYETDNIKESLKLATKQKKDILIIGSIYLAGEALRCMLSIKSDPVKGTEYLPLINWNYIIKQLYEYYSDKDYPEPYLELHKEDPFKVLISTIISQRTRDSITDSVASELWKTYPDAVTLANADVRSIERIIKQSGFYHNKAKMIRMVSNIIVNDYGNVVPSDMESLLSLPGVGRKTAGCVLVYGYGMDELPVDIHVHRISNRLGAVTTNTPEETETELKKIVPKDLWKFINHIFVKHGQNICKPVNPRCNLCPVRSDCLYGC